MPRSAREPRRRGGARAARRRTGGDGAGGRDGAALEEYRARRRFDRTSEPPGDGREAAPVPDAARRRAGEGGRLFVVQRHRARRLHYDLRLEVDGTLASWAVPKGPTLDPTVRSLAVHVEDHPIEYADFEGVIPAGEYGGGDVIVWDRGTWTPVGTDDPAAAIAAGELHFDVEAEKLRGRFVLVRTDRDRSRRERWLLLHKGDEHAVPGWDPEDHPRSVKTGRTNDEVAAAPEARWHSDRPPAQAEERLGAARWSPPTAEELAALDALPGRGGRWELQGRALELADLDAVLLPGRDGEEPVTRRDLVRWYATAAPAILPHLVDRPVARRHHPTGGRAAPWRTGLPRGAPDWVDRWRDEGAGPGTARWYPVLDSPPAVAWLAAAGAVELRPWLARRDDVRRPTWAVVDIAPGERTSFEDVLVLARLFRAALDHLRLEARPTLRGRHVEVRVPVGRGPSTEETRAWAEGLARAVGATVPELVASPGGGRDRRGRARLDAGPAAPDRPPPAPWSVLAAPGGPVAVPLEWDELDDPDLRPDRWTVRTAPARLAEAGDPLAGLVDLDQRLPPL
ncbi:MAG: DNA polymerase ligase N-terminal domain-containing protein [Thermoanaerobacterales bacterium]